MSGEWGIYRGVGGLETIDWDTPLAVVGPGAQSLSIDHDFGQQAVVYAAAPLDEASGQTPAVCYVQLDGQERLLPPPLSVPQAVQLLCDADGVRLYWQQVVPPGYARPDRFEVLCDRGEGFVSILQTLPPADEATEFYQNVTAESGSRWAVRARLGDQAGPMSPAVQASMTPPPSAIVL